MKGPMGEPSIGDRRHALQCMTARQAAKCGMQYMEGSYEDMISGVAGDPQMSSSKPSWQILTMLMRAMMGSLAKRK
jgi:hypothetical protein